MNGPLVAVPPSGDQRQAEDWIVPLDDGRSLDPALVGAKAANLALAAAAGQPVLDGATLSTAAPHRLPERAEPADVVLDEAIVARLEALYRSLSDGGRYRLVARSSSTVEDLGASSMAGRFTSVLGVDGAEALVAAVRVVLASSVAAALADGTEPRPMGVLIQRELDASFGGVLFGVDPLDAWRRQLLVEVTSDGPDALVSGRAVGAMATLSRHGRIVDADPDARRLLGGRLRRQLATMARRAEERFGEPQDIEWAVDRAGTLWLLQSRPVTATVAAAPTPPGPLLGPGPLGETFPLPLRRLEEELWLDPLREGMGDALGALGVVGRRQLARSALVRTVGGWAVCDLELLGVVERPSRWRTFAPRQRFGIFARPGGWADSAPG